VVRRRGAAPRGAAQQPLEPRRHQARRARRARHAAHRHRLPHRRRGARRAAAAAVPLRECEPVYETLPGWQESTVGITEFAKLPENARRYLARIEQLAGVPIDIVSTGADRAQTIVLRHPFD